MSDTMREILFRGKRVNNGEWIQGIYYPVEHTGFSIPGGIDYYIITRRPGCCKSQIQVIPETIGQFTGLTDKNGNKIFEGDILKATSEDTGEPIYAVVGYGKFNDPNSLDDDSIIGWYAEFRGIKTTILNGESEGCSIPSACEVVGNIHDNPELLEGNNA